MRRRWTGPRRRPCVAGTAGLPAQNPPTTPPLDGTRFAGSRTLVHQARWSAGQKGRGMPPLTRGAERCAPRVTGFCIDEGVRRPVTLALTSLAPLVKGSRAAFPAPAFLAGTLVSRARVPQAPKMLDEPTGSPGPSPVRALASLPWNVHPRPVLMVSYPSSYGRG